ncbi:unnamed protein product [Brachionus calyciflorus]|uniref:Uncharacterized protein n=1 Tax=Brachionus calyciflorus TaxID=104777 RepID=A0A813R087_9BILA|nr:unnamed protein product [Brachionus calyciflorus]
MSIIASVKPSKLIKLIDSIPIKGSSMSLAYSTTLEKIFVLDYNSKAIESYCINNLSLVKEIQLDPLIEQPEIICAKNDTFFIGSDESNKIYYLDDSFKIRNQFSSDDYKSCSAITCDPKLDTSFIYTSHEQENKVSKWDYENGKIVMSVEIQRPGSLCCNESLVFVASNGHYRTDMNSKIVERLGLSQIYVLNEKTLKVERTIQIKNWIDLLSINVINSKIYVTAFTFDDCKRSRNRSLLEFNSEFKLQSVVELEQSSFAFDVCLVDSKVVLLSLSDEDVQNLQIYNLATKNKWYFF